MDFRRLNLHVRFVQEFLAHKTPAMTMHYMAISEAVAGPMWVR